MTEAGDDVIMSEDFLRKYFEAIFNAIPFHPVVNTENDRRTEELLFNNLILRVRSFFPNSLSSSIIGFYQLLVKS
jgi:hypothetical protein